MCQVGSKLAFDKITSTSLETVKALHSPAVLCLPLVLVLKVSHHSGFSSDCSVIPVLKPPQEHTHVGISRHFITITFVKNQSLDSDEVQEWNKISVFS